MLTISGTIVSVDLYLSRLRLLKIYLQNNCRKECIGAIADFAL